MLINKLKFSKNENTPKRKFMLKILKAKHVKIRMKIHKNRQLSRFVAALLAKFDLFFNLVSRKARRPAIT